MPPAGPDDGSSGFGRNWQSPGELMNSVTGNDGTVRSLSSIWREGVGAYLLAISASAIAGTQAILDFLLFTPINIMQEVIVTSISSLVLEPLGLVDSSTQATAQAVNNLSILSLPAAIGVILVTFFIINLYLGRRSTSDLVPGSFTDFIGGADEGDET
jgi:cytosine/uracil/thiamine/allantoin permease